MVLGDMGIGIEVYFEGCRWLYFVFEISYIFKGFWVVFFYVYYVREIK